MKLLTIEASTRNYSLAVSDEEKVVAYKNFRLKNVLSSSVMPGIKSVLDKSGIPLNKLDGFAVGLGPGSFTGLRVGLATIQGLIFATQKPVVGISSLDILAANVTTEVEQICVITDAKRSMVFSCVYQRKGSQLKKLSPYVLAPVEDALKNISGATIFVGDGIALYHERVVQFCRGKFAITFAAEKLWSPQARRAVPLVLERFRQKKVDKIEKLLPLYLYPEDCQVRRS